VPGGAPEVLGGPVWWYFVGVYVLSIVIAAFTLVDSQRPGRHERLAGLPEAAWLYPVMSGIYLVCVVGVWIPGIPRVLSVVPVLLTPFALAVSVAYLLRVVFPKPETAEAAERPEAKSEKGPRAGAS
jgi:hypothetical protein